MSVEEREVTTPRPVRDDGWAGLRALALRIHFYAGVVVGPFLLVAALTGLLYIYTPQLEQLVYDHELHVPDAATSVSLERQAELAQASVPDGTLTAVRPAPTGTDTTQVIFDRPGLAESYHYTVFVDPHTGDLRGGLETYGSGQALPLRSWIDQLHRDLHLGEFGRLYSELAASWLWVVVLGGLVLWLGRRRRQRKLRSALLPTGGPAGRPRLLSWHGSVGLWAAAGLLFLSATGLTWSAYAGASIGQLRTTLDWTTPTVSTSVPVAAGDVGIDAVRQATAGLSDPVELRVPAKPGKSYVVQQIERQWPEKQDAMAVDPGTGQITDTLRFADYPLMAKLTRWGIDAHMGLLFGLPNQIVLTLLAAGLICLVCWGYRMWWLRRPARSERRWGRPPIRGVWRRVPGRILAPVLVAAVVVGYFLPVLGFSLLGFLILDGLLALRTKEVSR